MTTETHIDFERLARDVGLPFAKTSSALALLDAGNTVAFITRYRKDQTGGLDEEEVRRIQESAARFRQLAERKGAVLKSIAVQDKLTPELRAQIEQCETGKQLEDLYLPYRPQKQTLATVARQRGLEPLAAEIIADSSAAAELEQRANDFLSPENKLLTTDVVLQGVRHLVAERYCERADVRANLRPILQKTGYLLSARVELTGAPSDESVAERAAEQATLPAPETAASLFTKSRPQRRRKKGTPENAFLDYFEYRESLSRIPHHRVLAINRGEREKALRVRVEADTEQLFGVAAKMLISPTHTHHRFLRECVRDALTRMILPSLEREARRELTERAERHAVQVFARNLRSLLLQPPIRGRRVLAIDPGFRSGNKLAALDEFGNLIEHSVIYIVGRDKLIQDGRRELVELVKRHQLSLIAIGNGTACRETEKFVSEVIGEELRDDDVSYVIVNEAGASIYSTSSVGREELPEIDPVVRSAISIGRRLLDPLSELVKINPANIGVGMYQHDVKAKPLRETLDAFVASCVNYVGVDLNTASPALLSYVSGLNQLTARRIYEFRCEHGPFASRMRLLDVSGIGEATFIQAAGFLRISNGENPLDASWIHPESYTVARELLTRLNSDIGELSATLTPQSQHAAETISPLADRASSLNVSELAAELDVGELLLTDLITGLTRPTRDPREALPLPVFRQEVMKLDDLKSGMELRGTVLNVVDFGVFIDVGVSESALVHISRLQNKFVRDPHEVVSVGDILTVWVVEIDKQRRRVSLTAIPPGAGPQQGPPKEVRRSKKTSSHTAGQGPPQPAVGRTAGAHRKPPQPVKKPTIPLSDSMAEGREPLRSFSDLLQFYEKKNPSPDRGSVD